MNIIRVNGRLIDDLFHHRDLIGLGYRCLAVIVAGCALYGGALGFWRSPLQALYSAVKLPLLFLSCVATSGAANALLSQAMGAGLSARQTLICIGLGMTAAAALLGALSPVALFLTLQAPVDSAAYPWVLLGHTLLIGACGTIGMIKLRGVLARLTLMPNRVLATWFLVSGFTGCQLSWILSPFLALPDRPEPFFNPAAFSGNFYEYLWRMLTGGA